MFRLSVFVAAVAATWLPTSLAAAQGSGGVNAERHRDKPVVILVSLDGFRHDYQLLYHTPTLDRLERNGVKASALIPVYPTLTFPNHYSIATGLYPANHGIVGNNFFSRDRSRFYRLSDRNAVEDGTWYGGVPIWVAAEQAGMVSAAYYFVGTEADVDGVRPTYWQSFDDSIAGNRRVDTVLEWLALPDDKRPHLITLYFEDVDKYSHSNGVGSPQMEAAVERVDGYLDRLIRGLYELPVADDVYLIVVSDHGQTGYRDTTPFIIEDVVDLEGVRAVDHGAVVFLYFDEPDPFRARAMAERINARWTRGQAFVRGDAPEGWKVAAGSRFADVIVQADLRRAVVSTRDRVRRLTLGDHGWAPDNREMHGIFYATGPRLPQGERIRAINAVDVYPLMLSILGLPIPDDIDGDPERLVPLLDRAQRAGQADW